MDIEKTCDFVATRIIQMAQSPKLTEKEKIEGVKTLIRVGLVRVASETTKEIQNETTIKAQS